MTLLEFHLIAVSFWLGILAAETVLELSARNPQARRTIAGIHRWIDILFEGPVVVAVLLARAWPASPLLLVKVDAGLIPIIANLICILFVFARARATEDTRISELTRMSHVASVKAKCWSGPIQLRGEV